MKKLSSLILAILMLLSVCSGICVNADQLPPEFITGETGSDEETDWATLFPAQVVETVEQFKAAIEKKDGKPVVLGKDIVINDIKTSYEGGYIIVKNASDVQIAKIATGADGQETAGTVVEGSLDSLNKWTPLANLNGHAIKGEGYTVKGMYVNGGSGFVSTVQKDESIDKLNFENALVLNNDSSKTGIHYAAVVAGQLYGDIKNVNASGVVFSYNNVKQSDVAGIAARTDSTNDTENKHIELYNPKIDNCTFKGAAIINGTAGNAVAGGILAHCHGATVVNCVNYADVKYTGSMTNYGIGGIMGLCEPSDGAFANATERDAKKLQNIYIYNCADYGTEGGTSTNRCGGIIGFADFYWAMGCDVVLNGLCSPNVFVANINAKSANALLNKCSISNAYMLGKDPASTYSNFTVKNVARNDNLSDVVEKLSKNAAVLSQAHGTYAWKVLEDKYVVPDKAANLPEIVLDIDLVVSDKLFDGAPIAVTADCGVEEDGLCKLEYYDVSGVTPKLLQEVPYKVGKYKVVATPNTEKYKFNAASYEKAFTIYGTLNITSAKVINANQIELTFDKAVNKNAKAPFCGIRYCTVKDGVPTLKNVDGVGYLQIDVNFGSVAYTGEKTAVYTYTGTNYSLYTVLSGKAFGCTGSEDYKIYFCLEGLGGNDGPTTSLVGVIDNVVSTDGLYFLKASNGKQNNNGIHDGAYVLISDIENAKQYTVTATYNAKNVYTGQPVGISPKSDDAGASYVVNYYKYNEGTSQYDISLGTTAPSAVGKYKATVVPSPSSQEIKFDKEIYEFLYEIYELSFVPDYDSATEVALLSAEYISDTEIELTFSEPVKKAGGKTWDSIRYCTVNESGVPTYKSVKVGDKNNVLQYAVTLTFNNTNKVKVTGSNFTKLADGTYFGDDGKDCVVLLNIEGLDYGDNVKGYVDAVTSLDGTKLLKATPGKADNSKGIYDGAYVSIKYIPVEAITVTATSKNCDGQPATVEAVNPNFTEFTYTYYSYNTATSAYDILLQTPPVGEGKYKVVVTAETATAKGKGEATYELTDASTDPYVVKTAAELITAIGKANSRAIELGDDIVLNNIESIDYSDDETVYVKVAGKEEIAIATGKGTDDAGTVLEGDLSSLTKWTALANLGGHSIDGKGYSIVGMYTDTAFVNKLLKGEKIENLNFEKALILAKETSQAATVAALDYGDIKNVNVSETAIIVSKVNSYGCAAGIAARTYSTAEKQHEIYNPTINACSFDGVIYVSGDQYSPTEKNPTNVRYGIAGGIVGQSKGGTIINTVNYGKVNVLALLTSYGAGGILGLCEADDGGPLNESNPYTNKAIKNVYIYNCANYGEVNAAAKCGGIIGYADLIWSTGNDVIIENVFNAGTVQGNANLIGQSQACNVNGKLNVCKISNAYALGSDSFGSLCSSFTKTDVAKVATIDEALEKLNNHVAFIVAKGGYAWSKSDDKILPDSTAQVPDPVLSITLYVANKTVDGQPATVEIDCGIQEDNLYTLKFYSHNGTEYVECAANPTAIGKYKVVATPNTEKYDFDKEVYEAEYEITRVPVDITLLSAKVLNAKQIELKFSAPVKQNGNVFKGIRYCTVNGSGVPSLVSKKVGETTTHYQLFNGKLTFNDTDTVIYTYQDTECSLYDALTGKAFGLTGTEGYKMYFCFEGLDTAPTKKVGYVDNITSLDGIDLLKATDGKQNNNGINDGTYILITDIENAKKHTVIAEGGKIAYTGSSVSLKISSDVQDAVYTVKYFGYNSSTSLYDIDLGTTAPSAEGKYLAKITATSQIPDVEFDKEVYEVEFEIYQISFVPDYDPATEVALLSAKYISNTEIELTFSEPVKKAGDFFKGIRYCTVTNGVPNYKTDEVKGVLQYYSITPNFNETNKVKVTGSNFTALSAGTYYGEAGVGCQVLICFEGLNYGDNKAGYIDGITSLDGTKLLKATPGKEDKSRGIYDGAYVSIDISDLPIVVSAANKEYDGTPVVPTLIYNAEKAKLVGETYFKYNSETEKYDISLGSDAPVDAGKYMLVAEFTGEGLEQTKYEATYEIKKVAIRISAASKYADGAPATVTIENKEDGKVYVETYYSGTKKLDSAPTDVGSYKVVVSLNDSNYEDATATFSIFKPACKHPATEIKNAYDATKDLPGYTGDVVCSVCGVILSTGRYVDVNGKSTDAPVSKIVEGGNQKVSLDEVKSVKISSNDLPQNFTTVLVNGKEISSAFYKVASDKLTVTLLDAYIETLEEGVYTVSIVSKNGSADTKLTVTPKTKGIDYVVLMSAEVTGENELTVKFSEPIKKASNCWVSIRYCTVDKNGIMSLKYNSGTPMQKGIGFAPDGTDTVVISIPDLDNIAKGTYYGDAGSDCKVYFSIEGLSAGENLVGFIDNVTSLDGTRLLKATKGKQNNNGIHDGAYVEITYPGEEPVEEDGLKFTDVKKTDWFYDNVVYCVENELIKGVSETSFAPKTTTTRAMIVTILWRLAGEPYVNYAMSFEDLKEDWYKEAVRWAQSTKIVQGLSETEFGPDRNITREQFATILYRYAQNMKLLGKDSSKYELNFTDVDKIDDWAVEAVRWCNMNKIVNGRDDGTFDPLGIANRAESAAMIARFCELINK